MVSEPDTRSPTRSTSTRPKVGLRSLPEHSEIDAQRAIISRGRIRHKVSHIGSWKGS
ncbi:unnamed protein product [Brassica oleracea var. botrytis]